jgi:hypothetical protein
MWEAANLLNKNFQMVSADAPEVAPDCIALPNNFDNISAQKEVPWKSVVQATGTQICPYTWQCLEITIFNYKSKLTPVHNNVGIL